MKMLDKKKIEDVLPLTPMQEGMLFHYLKDPGSDYYVEQLRLEICGEIDTEFFERAWNFVIETNEMLRTVFRWEKVGHPIQIILSRHSLQPRYYDFSDSDSHEIKNRLEEVEAQDREHKFDLQEVPFRVTLCKIGDDKHEMIISNHHILYDGWSSGIILKEFFDAYRESIEGEGFTPPVKPAFKEFIKGMRTQDTIKQKEYWDAYLKGCGRGPGRVEPRKRKVRENIKNTSNYKFKIPGELKTKLDVFIKRYNITIASFLYGVWGVLLRNYHASGDIIFDATVSGRSVSTSIKGIENIVGLFINTLPLRIHIDPVETVSDFLSRVHRMLREWLEFGDSSPLPVREIVDKCRNLSLFDSVVVIENYPLDRLTEKDTAPLSLRSYSITERTMYDLTVIITTLDGIELNISYDNDLFDRPVISRLSGHVASIIEEMVTRPDKAVPGIDGWGDEEREEFLASIRMVWETEPGVETVYIAPRDEVEEKLAMLWSEILNIDHSAIGIDNNFFDFGGHSLKASQLLAAIQRAFEVRISLAEIFDGPTIRELGEYIREAAKESCGPIDVVEEKEYYALSAAQKRMVAIHSLEPESIAYNVSAAFAAESRGDTAWFDAFEQALKKMIRRHESLRTSFILVNGEPVQKIHKHAEFGIEFYDLSAFAGERKNIKSLEGSPEAIIKSFIRPFDLSMAPLLRVGLVKLNETRSILVFDVHHIIIDGLSMKVFIEESAAFYAGKDLPSPRIRYKDFSEWQKKQLSPDLKKNQGNYWSSTFAGEIPVLTLPTDYPRSRERAAGTGGDKLYFKISRELREKLRVLEKKSGATLYMILMAAYYTVLMKYSGQEDIVVGTLTDGRPHTDLKDIIGVMITTLAMRNYPQGEMPFMEFLLEVKRNCLKAFENSDYPFEELLKHIRLKRESARDRLFNTMFLLQNFEWPGLWFEDLELKPYRFKTDASTFDWRITAVESEGEIEVEIQYATRLFKEASIERFAGHYLDVLKEVSEEPRKRLGEVRLLSEKERHQVLVEFNASKFDRDPGEKQTVIRWFEGQVKKTPDHAALIGPTLQTTNSGLQITNNKPGGALRAGFDALGEMGFPGGEAALTGQEVRRVPPVRTVSLTYRELNEQSGRLARRLIEKGVQPDTIVGIMMEPSVEMITGIYAILKAGGTYLPIDPNYPQERIDYMLSDSGAKILVNRGIFEEEKVSPAFLLPYRVVPGSSHLVYIIYTSGTTGKPKGAGVYHRGFFNLMSWFVTAFGLNAEDRNLLLTSLSFDLTQKNIFASLVVGGALALPGLDYFDPAGILRVIGEKRLTWLNCTPGMINKIVEYSREEDLKKLHSLRYVFLGGEPLSMKGLGKWAESSYIKAQIVNTYGPTECTDICSGYLITEGSFHEENVPLGKPIYNVNLYVLDRWLRLLPVGVTGELSIGGEGVGLGYLNHPELTSERFIDYKTQFSSQVPFEEKKEKKLLQGVQGAAPRRGEPVSPPGRRRQKIYRTGDLVRWLPDGNIEFIGREDQQLKIRGYRIEPGEIETRLRKHEKVKEAVVLALSRNNEGADRYLCAYFSADEPLEIPGLKKYLSAGLPGYMIPSYFIRLDKFPLTAHGKIDRRLLPEPDPGVLEPVDGCIPFDETGEKLAIIWQEILGREAIRPVDNFFELGGDSLLVIQVIARIREEFGVDLPVRKFFRQSTIEELSKEIQGKGRSAGRIPKAPEGVPIPLSFPQEQIWFLQHLHDQNVSYFVPRAIHIRGRLDIGVLERTFDEILRRHEILRTVFPILEGQPVQEVLPHTPFVLPVIDWSKLEEAERSEKVAQWKTEEIRRPFDFVKGPMMRITLLKLKEEEYLLVVTEHHLVHDGWTQGVLLKDFISIFSALSQGRLPLLAELPIQYKDFAYWQKNYLKGETLEKQLAYWKEKLTGLAPVLELPTDRPRPPVNSGNGEVIRFFLSEELSRALSLYSRQGGVTLFMTMLAVFKVLLYRYTGNEDLCVGTGVANRKYKELENMLGMVINTLPLRTKIEEGFSFAGYLQEVKETCLEMYENEDTPFGKVVEAIQPERSLSYSPVFQVVFSFMDTPSERVRLPGLELHVEPAYNRSSKFDIVVVVEPPSPQRREEGARIEVVWEYNTDIFEKTTMNRLIDHYLRLLETAPLREKEKIARLPMLDKSEIDRLLYEFNRSETPYTRDHPIHYFFEAQVKKVPDHAAVVGKWAARGTALPVPAAVTYREIHERALRLAGILRQKGVKIGDITGIMAEPTIGMITGLLGILKAGGAYLPIDPHFPPKRVRTLLDESGAPVLLAGPAALKHHSFTLLQGLHIGGGNIRVSPRRPQIKDFDGLEMPDRSLVDYDKYSPFIGVTAFKHTLALQASRGCPYNCAYCHKIWPKSHVRRSVENIMEEIRFYYRMGVRRFAFIDDIFNLDKKNSTGVFEAIMKDCAGVQIFFPNGLRGDILTPGYIDLAVEAGTINIALSLETASPRLQRLIGKNIDLDKLKENMNYISKKYPQVILEIQAMHGFPSETEKEAMMTLEFIKDIRWIHFPYFHILKIYPNTEMAVLAEKYGITPRAIEDSANLAFHELPDTLPFDKHFTMRCQSEFINRYFLARERLVHVLSYQAKIMTEDEMVQKYNSYLPVDIRSLGDFLKFAGLSEEELSGGGEKFAASPVDAFAVPQLHRQMKAHSRVPQPRGNALRILLLDLSQYFSNEQEMLYDVVEPPLGLMYLLTAVNKAFGPQVHGKIAKSRIDFDSYSQLKNLVEEFQPALIGVRTLTFFKDFFHSVISQIRQWGFRGPIISGGPYATSDYTTLLQDRNIDLVVLGEGEETFTELIGRIMVNNGKLPPGKELAAIAGIAFVPFGEEENETASKPPVRQIILMDQWEELRQKECGGMEITDIYSRPPQSTDLAYVLFTSGSTGKPKGVMVEHRDIANLVTGLNHIIYRQYPGHLNIALVAPYVFDASVQQIFAALSLGHTLWIVPAETRSDGGGLKEFYRRYGIDISDGTPAHLRLMVEEGEAGPGMKHFIIGGEALPLRLTADFLNLFELPVPKITNVYGPTECCVDNIAFEISRENVGDLQTIPIGKPMCNQRIYIINRQELLQPIGVLGELCIGGDSVGRGYLNNPELTAEKFCLRRQGGALFAKTAPPCPSRKNFLLRGLDKDHTQSCNHATMQIVPHHSPIYRTGDLARWKEDGNIEFLGRVDRQVKIRGYRIELEEIENRIINYAPHTEGVLHWEGADRKETVYCTRCVLPASYPGIVFDGDGVCSVCREYEKIQPQAEAYFKTIRDFQELVEKARAAKKSEYDCLLLFSGGKDSSYVLYRLVEMGLKVLAFTFDNGYISETAFTNIRRSAERLGVDSMVCTTPKMKEIFAESLDQDHTVCTGCFKALTTISTQIALEKNINMVITGLSRGQVFETKLQGLYRQGITDVEEIEEKLLIFRKMYHSGGDKISRLLNGYRCRPASGNGGKTGDIPIGHFKEEVFREIHFVDFFRYEDAGLEKIKTYLKNKDTYWQQPGDTGFCSTNCIINDVGIYAYTRENGYHNYASPLSWSCRLGKITREEALSELEFEPDLAKIKGILRETGYFDRPIRGACVADMEDKTGSKYLCAYIVPGKIGALEEGNIARELRAYLSRFFPDYMIPSHFVPLQRLPLTSNGKVDRKALPNPVFKVISREIVPLSPVEEKLAEIWNKVLGIDGQVSTTDNFFELGGYSLKAAELAAKIHKAFHVKVPLAEIFERPTIEALSVYIREAEAEKFTSLEPAEEKEYYELSPAQKRLYILYRMDEKSTAYNIPYMVRMEGILENRRWERTIKKLIARHESLRTSFAMVEAKPVQRIKGEVEFEEAPFGPILNAFGEIANHPDNPPLTRAKGTNTIIKEFIRPFDLSKAPLLRVGLIKLDNDKHLLMVDMHHIISDGISAQVLVQDFSDLYAGKELPAIKLQYKDYAEWQNRERAGKRILEQGEYWKKEFEGEIPVLELPADYKRPDALDFEGNRVYFEIGKEISGALKALALETGATLYIVLLALYTVFLSKLTGREDIVIGSPVAGRRHADLEKIPGMFVNTLAFRNYPSGEKKFADFLGEVKTTALKGFENQEYQYEDLVEQISVHRDAGRNPLFDTMFVLQNTGWQIIEIPGLKLIPYEYENKTSKFDLTLNAAEVEEKILFAFEYSTKIFKRETIERFIGYFKNLISGVMGNHNRGISGFEVITEEERSRVLYDFNDTQRAYPGDKTINRLFEEQAGGTPDNIALVGVGPGDCAAVSVQPVRHIQLTYRELNEQSDRLAQRLMEKGVQPEAIVGIMMKRSIEMIVGVLGILKSGGAYLPIDPEYPQERIEYMLKDSNAHILVGDHLPPAARGSFEKPPLDPTKLFIVADFPNFAVSQLPTATSLAYSIYTSGSTGKPKGVLVTHRSVIRLVKNAGYIEFKDRDRILQTGALSFDASTFEIWGVLLNGPGLVLLPGERIMNPAELKWDLHRFDISTIWMTAPLFNRMVDADAEIFARLRNLLVGGDILSPVHINRVRKKVPGLKIINGYGPTENTTFSTTYVIDREYDRDIPIGRPITNSTAYIFDKNSNLQPIGVGGELVVGGDGVSRGYLNNPGLTAEKFTRDQKFFRGSRGAILQKSPPGRRRQKLYKTGDLARWQADGNIEFLGRLDAQVKIRGFRIEPEEIRSRLSKYPGIKESVVLMQREERGDKYLCAYYVSESRYGESELREYLSKGLPGYMIPSYFIPLERIPLTANGKIDRTALPEPGVNIGEGYTAPRDEIEKKLVGLWSEVLERDALSASKLQTTIGIEDNFFRLGGHSLKATVLISNIHKEFDVIVPFSVIFKTPRIKELAEYVKDTVRQKYEQVALVEKKEYYVLSSVQARLFFLWHMDKGSTAYNIPSIFIMEGIVDKDKLEHAVAKLIRRHESLRTSIRIVDEKPVQVVHEEVEFAIEYDRSLVNGQWSLVKCQGRGEVSSPLIDSFIRPFDLPKAPLLRVGLIKLEEDRHVLMIDMHHIISDGMSTRVLVRDFSALYAGEELPGIKLQYKDYAGWQNRERISKKLLEQGKYWKKEYEGEIPVLELPTDYVRPAVQDFEGSRIKFDINRETSGALKDLALETGSTLYIVLLALFDIFLAKISSRDDIVVGSPVAGRKHADLEKIIGIFVNTLALRNYPSGEKGFTDFLGEVKATALKGFENQEYQYEDLVEQIPVNRDAGRNPLFDTMFALQNTGSPKIEIPGLKLIPYEYENNTSKFDLTLTAAEVEEKILFMFEYSTKLFKRETIERFIVYFKNLIRGAIENHNRRISDFEIITEEEKSRILYDFNDTQREYPGDKTIHRLFEEQVEGTPDNIALVGAGPGDSAVVSARPVGPAQPVRQIQLTYRELNEQSHRLARLLMEQGAQTDAIVGIMMERSIEMIVGILGILKSGGAYLPIDPGYPQERIEYMLKDSNAHILVSDHLPPAARGSFEKPPLDPTKLFIISAKGSDYPNFAASQLPDTPHAPAASLAYVIYTSGSTGKPKGVLTTHANVIRVVRNTNYIDIEPGDRLLQLSNYAFDGSVFDIYGALLKGAGLVMINKDEVLEAAGLSRVIKREKITVFFATTALFNMLVEMEIGCFRQVRKVLFGGERVSAEHCMKALDYLGKGRIIHVYGPTETTVYATYYIIDSIDAATGNIPIGKPISNTTVFLLDRHMKPVPIGLTGEMHIGGTGVARGYLNNPGLTAEKFCPVSFRYYRSHRSYMTYIIYKTGDLARWWADGNIEFLGRNDNQVKIRGFRVELGEIESRILNVNGIKEAVVLPREDKNGEKYVCAYIVSENVYNIRELRECLSKKLPDYMIPSCFVQLKKIPLTPNGKIDRGALPQTEVKTGEGYTAPRNEIEKKLVGIWGDLLKRSTDPGVRVGIDDNFFHLGGHSLKATQLTARIHQTFDVKITLGELYKAPTIRGIAALVSEAEETRFMDLQKTEEKDFYELSFNQKRLWFIYQVNPLGSAFNMPGRIRLNHHVEEEWIEKTLARLVHRHESLRTSIKIFKDRAVQRLIKEVAIPLKKIDISGLEQEEKQRRQEEIFNETAGTPFDLTEAPLFRAVLLKLDKQSVEFIFNMHHIITDGWSMEIIKREFTLLYEGFRSGKAVELESFPFQYKDFAAWHNDRLQYPLNKSDSHTFWKRKLEYGITGFILPGDFTAGRESREGAGYRCIIEKDITERIRVLAERHHTTLFTVIFSVYILLLSRLSGKQEAACSIIGAGREHVSLHPIVGFFVNSIIYNTHVDFKRPFNNFLEMVKTETLELFQHQHYPLEIVFEELKMRYPEVSVAFNMLSMRESQAANELGPIEDAHVETSVEMKFDLEPYITEYKNGLKIEWSYKKNFFRPGTIAYIAKEYIRLIDYFSRNPGDSYMDYKRSSTAGKAILEKKPTHLSLTGKPSRTPLKPRIKF